MNSEEYSNQKIERNVLIVDDEQDILNAIVKKLLIQKKNRCRPWVAKDGLEALDLLNKYHFSAIILDINMRNLDGLGVCQELKKHHYFEPAHIIISSGSIDETNRQILLSLGIKHFLEKPYSIELLLEHLEQVLDSK